MRGNERETERERDTERERENTQKWYYLCNMTPAYFPTNRTLQRERQREREQER